MLYLSGSTPDFNTTEPIYQFYGLYITSTIPLGKYVSDPLNINNIADVRISKGECSLPTSKREQEYFEFKKGSAVLFWPHMGCFWIRDGKEVVVDPAQGVTDSLLRPALLGPVMAMLLLQRGFLVLHASSNALLARDGTKRAIAFLGNSGAGKSTIATALVRRGHQLLADDTIAVPTSFDDQMNTTNNQVSSPLIFPAAPHLKLRLPSVQAFGKQVDSLPLWHPDSDSYVMELSHDFSLEPAPLKCLYCLEEGNSIKLELMEHEEAMMHLLTHSYCMRALPSHDGAEDFFKCAQLVHQTPVFRLQRPKDFQRLPEVVRMIEEHQLAVV